MQTGFAVRAYHGDRHLEWCNAPDTSFAAIRDLARSAEAAGCVAFVVGAERGGHEPLTLLSALASVTGEIGLVAGIDPLVMPPYTAARRLAALDHASGGRAGWRLARTLDDARRREYVHVVRALWDSWAPDAHRCDKAAGLYIDTSRVHAVRHEGDHYRVAGPLDIPRPVQGQLPLYALAEDIAAGFDADVQEIDEDDELKDLPEAFGVLRYRTDGRDARQRTADERHVIFRLSPDARSWPLPDSWLTRPAPVHPPEHTTLRERLRLRAPRPMEAR